MALLSMSLTVSLIGCQQSWNSPHPPADSQLKIYYLSFSSAPKHLDPAKSYSADEYLFIENIYEPPLQYNYLKRPYELEPLTAAKMPETSIIEENGQTFHQYDIYLKPEIFYAPHPAFNSFEDGKREVTAEDYVLQIKRLADPQILSPIAPIMANYILGFSEFADRLREYRQQNTDDVATANNSEILNQFPMQGVEVISKHHYRVKLSKPYPQFVYWLSMPFFAAMPMELLRWHESPERGEDHLGIDWYPHGSGPFMMTKNNPNHQFVLSKNPHYHVQYYPDGNNDKRLPFLDKVVFNLEKESIPLWHKFLQGYYDASGVSSDNFDQAIRLDSVGNFTLSDSFAERDLDLKSITAPSIFYMGFNMLDETVGGYTEQQQKLRQAISIAINLEEYIAIFANGRANVAHGPIPEGIFGHQSGSQGINPYVYNWQNGKAQRKSIDEAKQLLAEAGYPNGIDPNTNEPLRLNYEAVSGSGGASSSLEWYRRQFQKLNIDLNLRLTDYNRFREKVNNGQAQILSWGWNADYPDPENFLFLLLGSNAKAVNGGANSINYQNPQFDRLFNEMKLLPNSPQRQQIINDMLAIAQRDAPWNWGFYPKAIGLYHQWVDNVHPIPITKNTLKYRDINIQVRNQKRDAWNQPNYLPLLILAIIIISAVALFVRQSRRRQNTRYTHS